jgi:DNA-binding IscR family transcriptional regulator
MLGTAVCSDDRACPAHKFWTNNRSKVLDFLKNTLVADVAAFETRRRWRIAGHGAPDAADGVVQLPILPGGM